MIHQLERQSPRDTSRIGAIGAAILAIAASLALLAACSSAARKPEAATQSSTSTTALPPLAHGDALWLERVGFGLDAETVSRYRRLGRARFLEQQLDPQRFPTLSGTLPDSVAAQISAMEISRADIAGWLADLQARYKAVNAMSNTSEQEAARKAINEHGNKLAYEAVRRDLLRAIYSRSQLQEQMVWFWLNHFNVYQYKANVRWLIGDYEEQAIRPYALGHFRDLVLATLQHPAMLQYLDNQQNAAGHINENYARELMELHTLGVNGGYTQQDVQRLAHILTGAGINVGDPPKLNAKLQPLYLRRGAFEFNPARHDSSRQELLGHGIDGNGFDEIENAVTLIVRQPACARFISHKIATYFVADEPPPRLVEKMANTFQRTDGDIAAVLHTMLLADEFNAVGNGKFKDPMRYVVSAVRLAYDGRSISNTHPLLNWLNALGEGPYNHPTPDGYPLSESTWASPGQISRRFEIARSIGAGNAGLFDPEDGSAASVTGFPQLSNRLYFEAIEPFLATSTRNALDRASSQQEWNTFLLSSPDFNYE